MARQCTQPKRSRNAVWLKEKAMLAEAQESRRILDEEQLAFLADPRIPDGQAAQTTIPNTVAFQTEDLDAYDSDCDEVSNEKAVLMVNLSNYGRAVQDTNLYAQQDSMILSMIEQMSEQMINHPTLYDGSVISSQHAASPVIDDEETMILEELNRLSEDFGKRFVPQQKLSDEQAFWLQTSHPNTDQSASSPVQIEAPNKLPKMETAVQQYFVDKQCFEIHKTELFLENDRLLQKIMSQDVMICVMNSTAVFDDVNVEMQSSESCVKCLDLDAELLNKQNV
ncbi:hypothetical protein Tco_1391195 [Tanacetum coccineum]